MVVTINEVPPTLTFNPNPDADQGKNGPSGTGGAGYTDTPALMQSVSVVQVRRSGPPQPKVLIGNSSYPCYTRCYCAELPIHARI